MTKFFLDMKDCVPRRDRVGIELPSNAAAIAHSKVMAKHFRDGSLINGKDLEIAVVNEHGREVHSETAIPDDE